MRGRVLGVGAVGILCAAGAVAALLVAVAVLDASGVMRISNDDVTPSSEMDRRFQLAQAAYAILQLAPPLMGGFLLAGIAILVLLARRWRAEHAQHPESLTPAPARGATPDRPAAGTR